MIADRRPGQPLAVLMGLLGAWIVLRIALWQAPFGLVAATAMAPNAQANQTRAAALDPGVAGPAYSRIASGVRQPMANADERPEPLRRVAALAADDVNTSRLAVVEPGRFGVQDRQPASFALLPEEPVRARDGHPADPISNRTILRSKRLSADAWLAWRAGPSRSGAATLPRYGGSQAGVTMRFALSPGGHRPALLARTTAALDPFTDRELAVGFAARPVSSFPARVQLEIRAREVGGSVGFAPAAVAVSELQPQALPLGFVADSYLAAGYVAGRQATPFIDGALRVEKPVGNLGPLELRVRAGAWGGAQKGAAAVDLGPGATVRGTLAGRPVTVALDYRLRVGGDAVPRTGPALTLSTGF
jgi:hypothetical protein